MTTGRRALQKVDCVKYMVKSLVCRSSQPAKVNAPLCHGLHSYMDLNLNCSRKWIHVAFLESPAMRKSSTCAATRPTTRLPSRTNQMHLSRLWTAAPSFVIFVCASFQKIRGHLSNHRSHQGLEELRDRAYQVQTHAAVLAHPRYRELLFQCLDLPEERHSSHLQIPEYGGPSL